MLLQISKMKLRSGTVTSYRIQDEITPCVICMDIKYLPVRLTSCGHTFCDPCIRTLVVKSTKLTIRCPICRCEIKDCKHVKSDITYKNIEMSQKQNLRKCPLPTKSNLRWMRKCVINYAVMRLVMRSYHSDQFSGFSGFS